MVFFEKAMLNQEHFCLYPSPLGTRFFRAFPCPLAVLIELILILIPAPTSLLFLVALYLVPSQAYHPPARRALRVYSPLPVVLSWNRDC
jgi:hypothetical protein